MSKTYTLEAWSRWGTVRFIRNTPFSDEESKEIITTLREKKPLSVELERIKWDVIKCNCGLDWNCRCAQYSCSCICKPNPNCTCEHVLDDECQDCCKFIRDSSP